MKLTEIRCPACNSPLKIPTDRKTVYCVYCGTPIYIDDEVERKEYTYRKVDEAEIIKSNNEVRMKEMEYRDKEREAEKSRKDTIDILMLPVYFMAFMFAVYLIAKYVILA